MAPEATPRRAPGQEHIQIDTASRSSVPWCLFLFRWRVLLIHPASRISLYPPLTLGATVRRLAEHLADPRDAFRGPLSGMNEKFDIENSHFVDSETPKNGRRMLVRIATLSVLATILVVFYTGISSGGQSQCDSPLLLDPNTVELDHNHTWSVFGIQ
ncbi:hypothetical protein RQP46_007958 [Phenoliferia psychrophenolica]